MTFILLYILSALLIAHIGATFAPARPLLAPAVARCPRCRRGWAT